MKVSIADVHVVTFLRAGSQNVFLLLINLRYAIVWWLTQYLSLLIAGCCVDILILLTSILSLDRPLYSSSRLIRPCLILLKLLNSFSSSLLWTNLSPVLVRVILKQQLLHLLLPSLVLDVRDVIVLIAPHLPREVIGAVILSFHPIFFSLIIFNHGHSADRVLLLHFLALRIWHLHILHCKTSWVHENRGLLKVLTTSGSPCLGLSRAQRLPVRSILERICFCYTSIINVICLSSSGRYESDGFGRIYFAWPDIGIDFTCIVFYLLIHLLSYVFK